MSKKSSTMSKKSSVKKMIKKEEIVGSETILEKIKSKTPWILGQKIRKPKIIFPKIKHFHVSLPIPLKTLSVLAIYAILFVLQTGVVYLFYNEPPALGADSSGEPIFLYPSIHESFIIEGIVASILIFCCSLGYVFLYHASKYIYDKNMALRIIGLGLILILTAFVALQVMIATKVGVRTIFT